MKKEWRGKDILIIKYNNEMKNKESDHIYNPVTLAISFNTSPAFSTCSISSVSPLILFLICISFSFSYII